MRFLKLSDIYGSFVMECLLLDDALCSSLQVGGFMIYSVEDIKKVAPLWLEYTEKVSNTCGVSRYFPRCLP